MPEIVKYVGLTSDAAAAVERFRESPLEHEHEIILRMGLKAGNPMAKEAVAIGASKQGCDIGAGVILGEGEKMYLFRYKSSKAAKKPEGVADARGGSLYIDGHEIKPSKGSFVQPALQVIQKKLNDVSETVGGFTSLDAWKYWYVQRGGRLVPAGSLRDKKKINGRNRPRRELSADDLF